jgi:hypothetical protein
MAGGLVSSIISGAQARKAGEAARQEYAEKKGFLDNTFNKMYYSDITNRTDVQNMLRLMNENQEKQAKRDEALSAVTGATTESQLASQDSRNKSYANALAEIASNASTLKDTYLQNYIAQRMSLQNPESALRTNLATQWSKAGTGLFAAGAQLLGGGIDDITSGKKNGALTTQGTGIG